MGIPPFVVSMLASHAAGERARRLRRSQAICFYGGRNGSGKSLAAIFDVLPDLDEGRPVLSTVRLLDYNNPRPCDDDACTDDAHGRPDHLAAHPLWVPFTDWPQLLDFRRGVIILDEIVGIADSSETNSIPPQVRKKFQELRRDECRMLITGLSWMNVHKRIRQAVQLVTTCESFLPVDAFDPVTGEPRMHRPRRLAVWRTFDARSLPMDDHSASSYEAADMVAKARHWIPDSPALAAYDSLAPVRAVGKVADTGTCAHCYGARRQTECVCEDYQSKRAAASRTARKARSAEHGHEGAGGPAEVPLRLAGGPGGRVNGSRSGW